MNTIPFPRISGRSAETWPPSGTRDDSVFLQLIIAEKEYVEAFKTYVFNSPLIRIGGGPYDRPPEEAISMDTTHFSMRVRPNVYPTNIERIEIAITNHTDLEGMGGEEYFIERFDGRHGKDQQPTAFVALGYPIFPNQTRDDFSATLMPELKETLRDCTGCARPSSPDRARHRPLSFGRHVLPIR